MISRTKLSMSAKWRAEEAAYQRAKQQAFDRDQGQCKARVEVPEVPCRGLTDPHHVRPLGRGGRRSDVTNLLTVCRNHHTWIHTHPLEAEARGLLV